MGHTGAQYQWAAVACSDLLEIATQLTPDEFKLYFIILALVRRNEGEPGHEFNSLRATRRMLRHFFGPIALTRLGRLAHRLHQKGFIRITPAPGCRLFIVLDLTAGVAPVRLTFPGAARGSVFMGRSSVPPGRPPAGAARPASGREEEKVPKRRRELKTAKGKEGKGREETPLPPGGEELTPPQPQGIPRLFTGLTALLSDSGFRAHLADVEARFDVLSDERLRRQVAVSMNSFLCAKGHFAIKNWPAFSTAYVRRSLEDARRAGLPGRGRAHPVLPPAGPQRSAHRAPGVDQVL